MFKLFNKRIKIRGKNNFFDKAIIGHNHNSLKIFGNNNRVEIEEGTIIFNTRIRIYGDNNSVFIGKNLVHHKNAKIEISISGNRNRFSIAPGATFGPSQKFSIGVPGFQDTEDSTLSIGKNCYLVETQMLVMENDSHLSIGDEVMMSSGVIIRLSDTHSVIDLQGNLLNQGKFITIGNHVWIGMDAKIGKNTLISDNSIIGWGSVVTRRFESPNIAIGGNPARVIKENINWSHLPPQSYLEQMPKKTPEN